MTLQYKIQEPKVKLAKNPLLLLLHGYGSNESDLFSFASELPPHYFVISARAPYDLQYESFAWYAINFDANQKKFSDVGQAKIARDLVATFIDELISKYNIDSTNVTLVGFSQGSILSYAIALSYPQKIQKVVAMSGYLNQEMATDYHAQNDFSHLNIFISHGVVDQVIPVEWAQKASPILNNLGIKNVYHEYPIGHGICQENFNDFKKWLLEN